MPPKRKSGVRDQQFLTSARAIARSISEQFGTGKEARVCDCKLKQVLILIYDGSSWKIPVYRLPRSELKMLLRYHMDTPQDDEDDWAHIKSRLYGDLSEYELPLSNPRTSDYLVMGEETAPYFVFVRAPLQVD